MGEIKPNSVRAKNAIILIWVVLGVEVASLFSSIFQYILLNNAYNGESISEDVASLSDIISATIALIYTIVFIISIVTFIQWFRRAYYNLHQRVSSLSFGEGWAAGAWFVPVISLFRPYQIMRELFVETRRLIAEKGIFLNDGYKSVYIGWWWAAWIISNFSSQIDIRYSNRAESIDEYLISAGLSIFNNIIGIPLAVVTIRVIKEYSNLEMVLSGADEPYNRSLNNDPTYN